LLDEPDAHLHSSLQEQLLDSLREIAANTGKQILVATHSTEILRNAEPSIILHVRDGKGAYLTEEHQKGGLLAGLGSDYTPRIEGIKRTEAASVRRGPKRRGSSQDPRWQARHDVARVLGDVDDPAHPEGAQAALLSSRGRNLRPRRAELARPRR